MQIELINDDHSCPNCYYEWFDDKAYPCSRCIHNKPSEDMFKPKIAKQTEPNPNANQHVQHVEYVEDGELKRCRECKHCVGEYRTPISAKGICYTYITCTANGCNYEQTEPQTDCLTCRYNSDEWDSPKCDGCSKAHSNYEPQTDCAWK